MGKSAEHPLLAPLASLTAYQDLLNRIQEGDFIGGNLRGLGLPRAVRLALLAALHHDLNKPILLLTNRADRALSLFDELGFWLPEGTNLYFAEPNPSFYENLPWSEGTRHDRLRVLTRVWQLLAAGQCRPPEPLGRDSPHSSSHDPHNPPPRFPAQNLAHKAGGSARPG